MTKDKWMWMPHAGHLAISNRCKFHLNTMVGDFIVSTVGEYIPDEGVREIIANSQKVELAGKGEARLADWMHKCADGIGAKIGANRRYESMVFEAKEFEDTDPRWRCCPYMPASWVELEMRGYNTASDAYRGHLELCRKWARRSKKGKRNGSANSA